MVIHRFDRHENMSSETRKFILEAITGLMEVSLSSTFVIENWLYGAFDGYNYYEVAIQSHELALVINVNPELGNKIKSIFSTINQYPALNFA